jgi:hypothetical protein
MIAWLAVALAAPTFIAEDHPPDAELGPKIWEAAVACTGWEPEVGIIRVHRDVSSKERRSGWWRANDEGAEIHLRARVADMVYAHEIAHTWFHGGDKFVSEGRAEALAICVSRRIGDDVPLWRDMFERADVVDAMPDLRTWSQERGYDYPIDELVGAYRGSKRLFHVLFDLTDDLDGFWDADLSTWEDLEGWLESHNDATRQLAAWLDEGVETQRLLLGDPDRDGRITVEERLSGTDPSVWDTDGDGFWDGADARALAGIPLPRQGGRICLPLLPAPGTEATVRILKRSYYGITEPHYEEPHTGRTMWLRESVDSRAFSGAWVELEGAALVPDPDCHLGPRHTLSAVTPSVRPALAPLSDALVALEPRVVATVGRPVLHAEAELGASTALLERQGFDAVLLDEPLVKAAIRREACDDLAALVLAGMIAADADARRAQSRAAWFALAEALRGERIRGLDVSRRELAETAARVEAAGGWAAAFAKAE